MSQPAVPESLETERLLLRLANDSDAALWHDAVREAFPVHKGWLNWSPEFLHPEVAPEIVGQMRDDFKARKALEYLVVRRSDETVVGCVSLNHIKWKMPKFEVSFWIRPSAAGQGLGTEAALAALTLAFDTLKAIHVDVRVDPEHLRGRKFLEKLGLRYKALLHGDEQLLSGKHRDSAVYRLEDTDWPAVKEKGVVKA